MRWLGVRWVVKEALYKAYPYPNTPDARQGGVRKESGPVHDSGITWKEVCLKYHSRSGEFSIPPPPLPPLLSSFLTGP